MSSGTNENQDDVKQYYPVWISSVEHIKSFSKIIEGLSFWTVLRRKYEIPPEFPYLRPGLGQKGLKIINLFFLIFCIFQFVIYFSILPFFSFLFGIMFIFFLFFFITGSGQPKGVPVALFSNGHLKIAKEKISFFAVPYKTFGSQFFNLLTTIDFQMQPSDIEKLDRYDSSEHFENMKGRFNLIWIRIKTKEEILGGDFLMCIGGKGPFMKKLRNKTNDLYQNLVSFKEKNKE